MADLFASGGDGILQFQDGTAALTSAQWSELNATLAKAPQQPTPTDNSPAPTTAPASTPAANRPSARPGRPAGPHTPGAFPELKAGAVIRVCRA